MLKGIMLTNIFISLFIKKSLLFVPSIKRHYCSNMKNEEIFASVPSFLPTLPKSMLTKYGIDLQNITSVENRSIEDELIQSDDIREAQNRKTKNVVRNNVSLIFKIRTGDVESSTVKSLIEENESTLKETLEECPSNDMLRSNYLSQAIEKFAEVRLLRYFFLTGRLMSPSDIQPCNDDEYLGAMIGVAQELSRYAVGRACVGDSQSIALCKELITQINGKMLEFDLRNGYLRKKYDGLKYANKKLEDLAYDLSMSSAISSKAKSESLTVSKEEETTTTVLVDASLDSTTATAITSLTLDTDTTPTAKKIKLEVLESSSSSSPSTLQKQSDILIPVEEIDAIRARLEAFDLDREDVIKRSRDVQKLAKQSIFAIHRGDLEDATKKLKNAKTIAENILLTVNKDTRLRQGAFSCSLEEWAEAALFLEWHKHRRIISKSELTIVNTVEYIGALSDFTGEIGRYAVARASLQDRVSVLQVFETDIVVSSAILKFDVNNRFGKKSEAVLTNLRKMEDIVYDLSILERGGRLRVPDADFSPDIGSDSKMDE